ncbi:MAG TPA: cellulase family glycosylhydrolase [Candidatus Saccharimonadales bacterium]|nr:cellulase family glycosylhydrolase [Candidatus Saccharimonadales bacterium]
MSAKRGSALERLAVRDGRVVDPTGHRVHLRGVNIGGWMNLEHFLAGYPGTESGLRRAMAQRLGSRATFFFERLRDYWFTDEDAAFIAASGLNTVRLPLNYRHFEADDRPLEYLERAFETLDRAIDCCARHGLYVILDLHAVQGWQNGDWHADNASRHALLWVDRGYQDRFVALWREIARRYAGRPVVVAYDLMNEPLSNAPYGRFGPDGGYQPDWPALQNVYRRTVEAIREVDPEPIIILEGDDYATRFAGLGTPFDDALIYSSHEYIPPATDPIAAFPVTIGGRFWNGDTIRRQFEEGEGRRFSKAHGVDLLVGEFGINIAVDGRDESAKLAVFESEIEAFEAAACHWTFWSYKGIGPMSWVYAKPSSAYARRIAPVLAAKAKLGVDFGWLAGFPARVQGPIDALGDAIEEAIPGLDRAANRRYLGQAAIAGYAAEQLQSVYVDCFADLSEAEIDETLASFALAECVERTSMTALLRGWVRPDQASSGEQS